MPQVDYELRQAMRRERLEKAAERARVRANAAYKRSDLSEAASGIPFGQPILVGHHSERRHRKAIERANNAMRKSIEEDKRAGELEAKAAAVGEGGISADDPEAIAKLTEKLAQLEAARDKMKAANKAIRAGDDAALVALVGEANAEQLKKPDFAGRIGFADYQLTNNSAECRRVKKRIEQLRAVANVETKTIETNLGFECVMNAEENRVQLVFPGKPSAEIRTILKRNGFRWAPSQGAWQRMLNNAGRYAAECVGRDIRALND